MKIVVVFSLLLLVLGSRALAQGSLSQYGLGEVLPQNTHLNPAFQAPGKLVVGLPVISEVGLTANASLSYDDAFTKTEQDSVVLDGDKLVANLKKRNTILLETRIPILYVGFKPESSSFGYSFFINDKVSAGLQVERELIESLWEGTSSQIDRKLNIENLAVSFDYVREYGIGVNKSLQNDDISVGVRLKLIQGLAQGRTDPDLNVQFEVNSQDTLFRFAMLNANAQTAGVDEVPTLDYLRSNKNKGFALDAGAVWEYNKLLRFEGAINDLGFVKWQDQVKSFSVQDTTFEFGELNFSNAQEFAESIDSLDNTFVPTQSTDAYKSMLHARTVLSASLILSPKDMLTVTMMNRFLMGQMKTGISVGYRKQILPGVAAMGSLVKLPQHWPMPGAAVVLKAGPVQYYLASDNLLGFVNVTNMSLLDVKMGFNLLLGNRKPKMESNLPPAHRSRPAYSSKGNGVDYPTDPRLHRPGVFRQSGIYDVIPKRKEPKSWKGWLHGKVGE